MSATTVKIDGAILAELRRIQPAGETLTSLVRDLLASEIRRRKMAAAAVQYAAFLIEHPQEGDDLGVWASAPLDRDVVTRTPSKRSKRSRKR